MPKSSLGSMHNCSWEPTPSRPISSVTSGTRAPAKTCSLRSRTYRTGCLSLQVRSQKELGAPSLHLWFCNVGPSAIRRSGARRRSPFAIVEASTTTGAISWNPDYPSGDSTYLTIGSTCHYLQQIGTRAASPTCPCSCWRFSCCSCQLVDRALALPFFKM